MIELTDKKKKEVLEYELELNSKDYEMFKFTSNKELTDREIRYGLIYARYSIYTGVDTYICLALQKHSNFITSNSFELQNMYKISRPIDAIQDSDCWWDDDDKQSRIDFLTKEIEKYK